MANLPTSSYLPVIPLRGTAAQVASTVLPQYQLVQSTDQFGLFIGDGTTTGGHAVGSLNQAGVVYVSSISGSDSTGTKYRADKPYQTLSAAASASVAGDTIVVLPGTYTDKNIKLVTGINWTFAPSASVSVNVANMNDSIFTDFGTPATCSLIGSNNNFSITNQGPSTMNFPALLISNTQSLITSLDINYNITATGTPLATGSFATAYGIETPNDNRNHLYLRGNVTYNKFTTELNSKVAFTVVGSTVSMSGDINYNGYSHNQVQLMGFGSIQGNLNANLQSLSGSSVNSVYGIYSGQVRGDVNINYAGSSSAFTAIASAFAYSNIHGNVNISASSPNMNFVAGTSNQGSFNIYGNVTLGSNSGNIYTAQNSNQPGTNVHGTVTINAYGNSVGYGCEGTTIYGDIYANGFDSSSIAGIGSGNNYVYGKVITTGHGSCLKAQPMQNSIGSQNIVGILFDATGVGASSSFAGVPLALMNNTPTLTTVTGNTISSSYVCPVSLNEQMTYLTPTASIPTYTVYLPTPQQTRFGQTYTLTSTQPIGSLTVSSSNGSVIGSPFTTLSGSAGSIALRRMDNNSFGPSIWTKV